MGYINRENRAQYQRDYRKKKRDWALQELGGKCQCGSTDRLEFDHIDRRTKIEDVADIIVYGTWEELRQEVKKCQLLCHECHRKKSVDNGDVRVAQHGSFCMYQRHFCRCSLCVNFANEKNREYKRIRRNRLRGHGSGLKSQ